MYMPETALLHRVVSDVKQREKTRPNLIQPELLFSGSDQEPEDWTLT